MLTMREFERRFAGQSKVQFASLYPGCIAETGLFREHYDIFKWVAACARGRECLVRGRRCVHVKFCLLCTPAVLPD